MTDYRPRCRSLHRVVLHREGGLEVYIRCKKAEGHQGHWHDHKLCKWRDEKEDGWFEDEYDEDVPA